MSRISKELAGQIAFKLTEKSRIASEKLHVEFREVVTSIYEQQTPKEVSECFKKYPDWFYTANGIKLNGHGFNWDYVSSIRTVIANNGTNCYITMNDKNSKQIQVAKQKWIKSKEKYNSLKEEAEQALLALKTFNNIRKELPQAESMLPPPMSNALVCNFTSLKSKLNHQPEVELVAND